MKSQTSEYLSPSLLAKAVRDAVQPELAKWNFIFKKKHSEKFSFYVLFTKDYQYIKIQGSIYPREFPYIVNVVLGEGSTEWPDSDWNSIALWRLINHKENSNRRGPYQYPENNDAHKTINKAITDLVQYANDFIDGDLTAFTEVRIKQTDEREPYQIYETDKFGNRTVRADSISARLKEKYGSV